MDEAAPTLKMPPGADVAAYKRALLERFANPALRHRTWQIAMDGSQKLPQRLLGTIRDRLAAGAPIDRLVLGVAGWMRYVTGIDEAGQADRRARSAVRAAARIADEAGLGRRAPRPCPARRARDFRSDLAADPRFAAPVQLALEACCPGREADGGRVRRLSRIAALADPNSGPSVTAQQSAERRMSRPLVVSIPHNLGREEALRRLKGGMGNLRSQFGDKLTKLEDKWTGDRMDFDVRALGQSVSGHLEVFNDSVRVEVQLPWVLSMIVNKIRPFIEKQGQLMLEKK